MVRTLKQMVCGGLRSVAVVLNRLSRKTWPAHLAALVIVGLAGTPVLAGADEVRTFAVTVDGKPGGTCTIATVTKDGVETTTVATEVKVKVALRTHVYELSSVEVWKDGRLASVEARSNDDGKKRTVAAVAGERGLTVTVNKDTRKITGDVLTATGVRVPAGDAARDAVLFDAEDGSETAVRVEPLGACRVMLNGQAVDGVRFKLTGKDVAAEWWFDKGGRVIRQAMTWDGHKVVLELTAVR